MKRASSRFNQSIWTKYLIPMTLGLLLLALLGVIGFVVLFALGFI